MNTNINRREHVEALLIRHNNGEITADAEVWCGMGELRADLLTTAEELEGDYIGACDDGSIIAFGMEKSGYDREMNHPEFGCGKWREIIIIDTTDAS